jgi:hypothetical protein
MPLLEILPLIHLQTSPKTNHILHSHNQTTPSYKMAETETQTQEPTEPQSRHVIYCGGTYPNPTITSTSTNFSLQQSVHYPQRYNSPSLSQYEDKAYQERK